MYAVIMAGGRGSRFWPRSRKKTSKQVLNIIGRHTMLQDTCARIQAIIPPERTLVITNKLLEHEIRRQLPQLPPDNVIAEPANRSTAACIGLAAVYLRRHDPDGMMAVFAADHLIKDVETFQADLLFARTVAEEQDALVAFGIPPARPETGFGYIKSGELLMEKNGLRAFKIDSFVEKPDLETAEAFFKDPAYLVNSGMFVWKISKIIEEIEEHLPQMKEGLERIADAIDTPLELKALGEEFPKFPNISIDKAVMEKTARATVVPARFDWNDLGSWSSLHDVWPKDENNNACIGRKLMLDTTNTLIYSPDKLVVAVGVDDLIIVETDDALLVCRRDKAQDVSKIVDILRKEKMEEFL